MISHGQIHKVVEMLTIKRHQILLNVLPQNTAEINTLSVNTIIHQL